MQRDLSTPTHYLPYSTNCRRIQYLQIHMPHLSCIWLDASICTHTNTNRLTTLVEYTNTHVDHLNKPRFNYYHWEWFGVLHMTLTNVDMNFIIKAIVVLSNIAHTRTLHWHNQHELHASPLSQTHPGAGCCLERSISHLWNGTLHRCTETHAMCRSLMHLSPCSITMVDSPCLVPVSLTTCKITLAVQYHSEVLPGPQRECTTIWRRLSQHK